MVHSTVHEGKHMPYIVLHPCVLRYYGLGTRTPFMLLLALLPGMGLSEMHSGKHPITTPHRSAGTVPGDSFVSLQRLSRYGCIMRRPGRPADRRQAERHASATLVVLVDYTSTCRLVTLLFFRSCWHVTRANVLLTFGILRARIKRQ